MIYRRYIKLGNIGALVCGLFLSTVQCRSSYDPRLIEYFKAEQALRDRVSEEHGLDDSLQVLQKQFDIDIEKELEYLRRNPEQWTDLLDALNTDD